MGEVKVGIGVPRSALRGPLAERRAVLADIADGGLDHVGVGDHVSFFGGVGFDGLIQAAQLSALHDSLEVVVAVYLLALRHPVVVARQLEGIAGSAPGRLVLGVGVGGEDPHEFEVCGVDPKTRGRRTDESLVILRRLMTGEPCDFAGEHFRLDRAIVRPAVEPPVPILVGGRSDAAVRRAARHGDGYLGIWISPGRFRGILGQIAEQADAAGRSGVGWEHGMFTWCGFGASRREARERVAEAMTGLYQLPFERFERYTPFGCPADVAEFLHPYVEAGARRFHLAAVAEHDAALVEAAAEVKRLLSS